MKRTRKSRERRFCFSLVISLVTYWSAKPRALPVDRGEIGSILRLTFMTKLSRCLNARRVAPLTAWPCGRAAGHRRVVPPDMRASEARVAYPGPGELPKASNVAPGPRPRAGLASCASTHTIRGLRADLIRAPPAANLFNRTNCESAAVAPTERRRRAPKVSAHVHEPTESSPRASRPTRGARARWRRLRQARLAAAGFSAQVPQPRHRTPARAPAIPTRPGPMPAEPAAHQDSRPPSGT